MSAQQLELVIGSRRAKSFLTNVPITVEQSAIDLYLFDLNLRALVIKAMSIVEITLENQINHDPESKSFGALRRKIENLGAHEQFIVANHFGFSTQRELRVALRNFNALRNRAAHHEPLWRRRLHFGVPRLRGHKTKLLQRNYIDLYSPAASLSVLAETLVSLPFLFDFQTEFQDLIHKSPIDQDFLLTNMGFEVP